MDVCSPEGFVSDRKKQAALHARGVGITDVGLQRDHNEDTYAVLAEYGLFVVADGMGGHQAGDVASRLASESIANYFQRTSSGQSTGPYALDFDSQLSEAENRLIAAIRMANRQIYEHSLKAPELRGMGTTVVGAVFSPASGEMYFGHVGDSRAYRIRDGAIVQLTKDHSLVNDYLRFMPDMSEKQRAELPKNVITRALGMQDSVEVDILGQPVQAGDRFLLCSDGLSGMLSDEEMRLLVERHEDLSELCAALTALANEHGGEDNITAVVVSIDAVPALANNAEGVEAAAEGLSQAGGADAQAPVDLSKPNGVSGTPTA